MILMVDGTDPHFTDRITQMGMTLEGISMVGRFVGRTAGEICQGKIVGFVGSGYSSNPQIVSLGWLASIAGVTGVELCVEEPEPIPAEGCCSFDSSTTFTLLEMLRRANLLDFLCALKPADING